MPAVGADLEQLMELKNAIISLNNAIQQNRPKISRLIANVDIWKGPAADKFRGEWTGQFDKSLNTIAQGLDEASRAVQTHHDNIARATGVQ